MLILYQVGKFLNPIPLTPFPLSGQGGKEIRVSPPDKGEIKRGFILGKLEQ